MLFWLSMMLFSGQRLGVCRQEMPQRHEKLACVVAIVPMERGANVIPQHVPDRLGTVRSRKQVLAERSGCDFRYVLMLGDRQDLRLVQVAHRDAVLECDQECSPATISSLANRRLRLRVS